MKHLIDGLRPQEKPMKPFRHHCIATGVLALLSATTAQPQAVAPGPGLDCMLQPHQTVQVGTASPGVIKSMSVDRGDFVRKGQPLVQLNAEVEHAALAVARERASQSGELVAARGAHDLAKREAQRAAELVEENFVSRTFFDKQRAEAQVAEGRGEQAREKIKLAAREVALANAQLAQRTVYSPIDGVVVERFAAPGEYVEQKPVLRIAGIDPLRVDVLVPAVSFGQVALGAKASVVPEMLNRKAQVAIVTSVDRVVDAASNTFRVRLEMPNPGGALPPGLRCKADLGLRGDGAARAAPAVNAAPSAAAVSATRPMATQAMVRRTEPVEPAQERMAKAATVTIRPEPRVATRGLQLKMSPIELPPPVAQTPEQLPAAKLRKEAPITAYPTRAQQGAPFQYSARAPQPTTAQYAALDTRPDSTDAERDEAAPFQHSATFAQYIPRP
jgi:RND family efflux transporter MFP subunit